MKNINPIKNEKYTKDIDTSILDNDLRKIKQWINSTPGLAFFTPLSLSTPVHFKSEEYMKGRFGSAGIVVTDTNWIFWGADLFLSCTMLQNAYMLLNALLQIVHLHPHRIMPLIEDKNGLYPNVEKDVRIGCASIAAMLFTNTQLNGFLSNYFEVLDGCNGFMTNVTKENYWQLLGWEKIEDVPQVIQDIDPLLDGVVERMVILFIKNHNPNNPPKAPEPLWGEGTGDEKGGKDSQAFKNQAKQLARSAVNAAKSSSKNKQAGDFFCPFEMDDLHTLEATPISYKQLIAAMVVSTNDDFGGYDRRQLGTNAFDTSYVYSMESESVTCVIYVDVSGSLISNVIDILMEVKGIVEAFPTTKVLVKYFHSHVIEDEEPKYITPNTPLTEWKFPNETGGTSWEPIAKDIEENFFESNVVVISDGYFYDEFTGVSNSGQRLFVATQSYNENNDYDLFGTLAFSDIDN